MAIEKNETIDSDEISGFSWALWYLQGKSNWKLTIQSCPHYIFMKAYLKTNAYTMRLKWAIIFLNMKSLNDFQFHCAVIIWIP